MVPHHSFISLFIILQFLNVTYAVICTTPRSILPTPKDCHELVDAIELLSRLPPYNEPKIWARHYEDTESTRKLPKDYWVQGRGPSTCAIHVDVIPYGDINAEDRFGLINVANAGEIITEQCLVRHRKLGLEYPGLRGNVEATLLRTDAPRMNNKLSSIRGIIRLGSGRILFEATSKVNNETVTDVALEKSNAALER